MHKVVRPVAADKIANLAQSPKSLGTAVLSNLHHRPLLNKKNYVDLT